MAIISLILATAYVIFSGYLFPFGRTSLDVFKLNPVLLPSWWKFVGIGWLSFVVVYSIIDGNFNFSTNNFLLSGMYFGLLQIAFSKEKNEDEFSSLIRIKAMFISVISLFIIVGLFSSIALATSDTTEFITLQFLMLMFNSILLVYLAYFYWTKYGFKRKRDEK